MNDGEASDPDPNAAPVTPEPPRPRVWPSVLAVLAVLVLEVTPGFLAGVVVATRATLRTGGPLPPEALQAELKALVTTPSFLVGNLVAVAVGSVLLLLLLGWRSPQPARVRFALKRPHLSAGAWALVAAAGLAVGIGAGALVTLLHGDSIESSQAVQKAVQQATAGQTALLLLLLSVSAPITEELLMRGFVQTRLVERWGPRVGIVVTAVMFGALHLEAWQAVFAGVLGLYFGWLAWRTGSVVPCIVGHLANNAWFALAMLVPQSEPASPMADEPFAPALMIAFACVGWAAFVVLLALLKNRLDRELTAAAA